jgi:hypothetical protein
VRYFRRACDEPRRDEFDAWGTSVWYFEFDDQGSPRRQVEVYQNGIVVKYDTTHLEDEYGGLSEPSADVYMSDQWRFEISAEEFEAMWKLSALNNPVAPSGRAG